MSTNLTTFLEGLTPVTRESTVWGKGTIPLVFHCYVCEALPPVELVTSVRAVVVENEHVLVVLDPNSYHLLPGGRREVDEDILQTLEREILEETGWSLSHVRLLGFRHFRHLGPRLDGYPTYPDFLQLVYCGRPATYHPEAREKDGYELEAVLRPYSELPRLNLRASDLAFLEAARQVQLQDGNGQGNKTVV